jgi:hypothetical protein
MNRLSSRWCNGSLGATLALPFLANITPNSFLLALLIIPLVFALLAVRERPNVISLFISSFSKPGVILIWLLILSQLVGMLQSENPWQYSLLKDFAAALAVGALASYSAYQIRSEQSVRAVEFGFLAAIIFFGIALSFVGLFKFYLLQHGVAIDIIRSGDRYPWGSSLKTDYNFFSLTILIAVIGLIDRYFKAKQGISATLLSVSIGIIMTGGIYAGSRRFWLLAPLIILFSLTSVWLRSQNRKATVIDSIKLSLVVVPVVLVTATFLESTSPMEADVGPLVFERSDEETLDSSVRFASDANLLARAGTLVSPAKRFGIGSRSDRWKYAFELIDVRTLLIGMGFDYRDLYSCRFLDCRSIDYPHSPLLSALLYGGFISAGLSILFVVWLAHTAARLIFSRDRNSIVGVVVLAVVPFHLVSGDTFFSLPGLMTTAILASVVSSKFDRILLTCSCQMKYRLGTR